MKNIKHSLAFILLTFFLPFGMAFSTIDVSLTNQSEIFENEIPTFYIETATLSPEIIHWQMSTDADFNASDLLFEDIAPYTSTLSLPPYPFNLMENKKEYFLRTRILAENMWSDWSSPASFYIVGDEAYTRNRHVSEEIWNKVAPHLLPDSHPIKPILDQIFSKKRVLLSIKSLKKAGFHNPKPRKWTHLIVTTHPEVPGYVFKVFLDSQRYFKGQPEYVHWLERIQGALTINAEIKKRGWDNIFKVPKKWIYPLPEEPSPPKEFIRKNFILVEEDMNIFDTKENHEKWKSDWVTEGKLEVLYTLLEELGLHDCAKPDNIPFSIDGKISFVDTETFYQWPVLYKKLTPHLSPEMQAHWENLIKK